MRRANFAGDVRTDRFQACEGRLGDGAYVKQLAYRLFDDGAFAGRAAHPAHAGPATALFA